MNGKITTKLTEEILMEYLKDCGENMKKTMKYNPLEYPKHYVWEDENGQYSAWEIVPGMVTGDGGMELFSKALKEQLNEKSITKK